MRIALVGAECEENLAVRYIHGALEQAGHDVVQVVFNDEGETERAAGELAASSHPWCPFSPLEDQPSHHLRKAGP